MLIFVVPPPSLVECHHVVRSLVSARHPWRYKAFSKCFSQTVTPSNSLPLISQEEVTFLSPGKWLILLSCLVNAIIGWLKHSPPLWIQKKKLVFSVWRGVCLPVWVLCMTKQGHVHHRTRAAAEYGRKVLMPVETWLSQEMFNMLCRSAAERQNKRERKGEREREGGEGVSKMEPSQSREAYCWCWLFHRLWAVRSLLLFPCETVISTTGACSDTHRPMSGHVG